MCPLHRGGRNLQRPQALAGPKHSTEAKGHCFPGAVLHRWPTSARLQNCISSCPWPGDSGGKTRLMKARTQIPATSGSLHFQWGYPGWSTTQSAVASGLLSGLTSTLPVNRMVWCCAESGGSVLDLGVVLGLGFCTGSGCYAGSGLLCWVCRYCAPEYYSCASTSFLRTFSPAAWLWSPRPLFSRVRGSNGPVVLGKPLSPSLALANRLLGLVGGEGILSCGILAILSILC